MLIRRLYGEADLKRGSGTVRGGHASNLSAYPRPTRFHNTPFTYCVALEYSEVVCETTRIRLVTIRFLVTGGPHMRQWYVFLVLTSRVDDQVKSNLISERKMKKSIDISVAARV